MEIFYFILLVIAAIMVICFLVYVFSKLLQGNNLPPNMLDQLNFGYDNPQLHSDPCPSDPPDDDYEILPQIDSRYYELYKDVFDTIATKVREAYKTEWLIQSLDMGRQLENEGFYVIKSINQGLPYFCETGQEFELFFLPDKPVLRGSIKGMLDLVFYYDNAERAHSHPAKQKYWKDKLCELAATGNYEAQGALCSNYGKLAFSESEMYGFKQKYESNLLQQAQAGNCVAQLAVGEFLSTFGSKERLNWFSKAAQQGFSDAWYQLGRVYELAIRFDLNNRQRSTPLSMAKIDLLKEKAVECYMQGAEADNGVMAAWCQYEVARYYFNGNSFILKDEDLAIYWYNKSQENGDNRAENRIMEITKDWTRSNVTKKYCESTNVNIRASNLIESEEIRQCRQFLALVLALYQRGTGRSGYIRFSLDDEDKRFVMRAFVLGGNLRDFIKEQMDQKEYMLLYRELDNSLMDASKFEPCLESISSFHELNIYFSTEVSSGDIYGVCKIEFEQFISVPGNNDAYFSAIEQIIHTKYPGKFYRDEHAFGAVLS